MIDRDDDRKIKVESDENGEIFSPFREKTTLETLVDDDDEEKEPEFVPEVLLAEITEYMRVKYFYCIYCGATFNDEKDLTDNCPGNAKDLHDEL